MREHRLTAFANAPERESDASFGTRAARQVVLRDG
jgi:hypothetical protein